ncbi:MAG TPA: pilus assembly protein TadG-related protein [Candidatus Limnocylindrales bacterium]|nr:pilus assembly protein TadG-related protein [Candidatus Limnocylindrales bacterium]
MREFKERNRERGAITILAVGGAIALLGMAGLAIDVGYAVLTRVQLQNIADAGASSGSRELGRVYAELGPTRDYRYYTLTEADRARILANINEFTTQNEAAGNAISITGDDVIYGTYDNASGQVTPTMTGPEAVIVKARRDETANGSVSTLLSHVLGVDTFQISASSASAGVSAASWIPGGTADIPVAISKAWFSQHDSPCGADSAIRFYPTGSTLGCAGWHTFNESPASAAKLKHILNGLTAGTYQTPPISVGSTIFNFNGGTIESNFDELQKLYNKKKDAQGNWRVLIPVYDMADCSNPNGPLKIIGVAHARIWSVKDAPSKQIDANVECKVIEFGSGDGNAGNYGTVVSKPRTIQ